VDVVDLVRLARGSGRMAGLRARSRPRLAALSRI